MGIELLPAGQLQLDHNGGGEPRLGAALGCLRFPPGSSAIGGFHVPPGPVGGGPSAEAWLGAERLELESNGLNWELYAILPTASVLAKNKALPRDCNPLPHTRLLASHHLFKAATASGLGRLGRPTSPRVSTEVETAKLESRPGDADR